MSPYKDDAVTLLAGLGLPADHFIRDQETGAVTVEIWQANHVPLIPPPGVIRGAFRLAEYPVLETGEIVSPRTGKRICSWVKFHLRRGGE